MTLWYPLLVEHRPLRSLVVCSTHRSPQKIGKLKPPGRLLRRLVRTRTKEIEVAWHRLLGLVKLVRPVRSPPEERLWQEGVKLFVGHTPFSATVDGKKTVHCKQHCLSCHDEKASEGYMAPSHQLRKSDNLLKHEYASASRSP